ncbi:PEP/pyruvate-binding domain-containing protein [Flexivirga oryzae]|uniref:Phosphoenolpyruvate synthase n=1 Tax=Flexivirga oryzae TaxID=1794944 RepID=A0A839N7E6_9MICO|nr:PEP/pyruvate-binding domain-containing protein [Flexivirga oryzae]MBB2891944.1 pyruvate,water dikinase [Flexivirga oryzae]
MNDYIVFFDSGHEPTLELLGGKCASLVSMTAAGMPVPPGFAVTTAAFDHFVDGTGLRADIKAKLAEIDADDVECVDRVSASVREAIEARDVPEDMHGVLHEAYDELMSRFEDQVPVAVRSSATAEDLPDASFAGQQDTYLWLSGYEAVHEHLRRCWASLYTSRAITYRLKNNIPEDDLSMAVAIQKMVNAKAAGVAMTLDPANGDRSKIVVDASWGVGEMVVSGQVTPDNVLLDKVMLTVVREKIGDKHAELVPDPASGELAEIEVAPERRSVRCLTDEELVAVATMAKRAEKHYGCPQDIEFAFDRDLPDGANLLLLQSRPETVHSSAGKPAESTPAPAATGFSSITASLLGTQH